ncbi:hypothetical protein [Saccharothrix variisporea]|uniref:Uncharacterized protein n=1 Tax=Saccharothrix variisporea TaxID=543527 RepID=A0A495XM31_9PSEU|nr:hypothetical protein [Saccharothrix variisporea]RKT74962.1 hypothetical protein DFJ66_8337 [Saccharothrix variisporea]
MSDPKRFVDRVRELAGDSPGRLAAEWREFAEIVEDGYTVGIDEYEHDLRVRDRVERVLTDPELGGMEESAWVRAEVAETDTRFRALLTDEPVNRTPGLPWWRSRYPKRAGADLARDVEAVYGVRIEAD